MVLVTMQFKKYQEMFTKFSRKIHNAEDAVTILAPETVETNPKLS